jgi:transmembrane sensor
MKDKENYKEKDATLSPEELKEWWESISSQLAQIEKEKKKKRKQAGVAGIVIVLLGLAGFIGYNAFAGPDVYTASKSDTNITLRDGTVVTLMKGGMLSVEKSMLSKTRDVELKGDAVFRVTSSKDHPFIVHGEGYQAKVLGTVFKVTQSEKNFGIELYEGKVAIRRNGDTADEYVLHPRQRFTNYGHVQVAAIVPIRKSVVNTSDVKKSTAESSVHLQFTGCRLQDALEVVEKTYGIRVGYLSVYQDKMISIDLNGMTGKEVLQNIALSLGLQLTEHETGYQLEN